MSKKRYLRFMALFVVLALTAAACGGSESDDEPSGSSQNEDEGGVQAGGVYRVGVLESFNYTNGFDPTGEYLGSAFSMYGNLLLRTLVGYRHVAGDAGNEVIPDLAELPEISGDGLTYTFTIKDGVMFGPPLSRQITSDDALYAFERIGTESLVAQYGFYYDVIEGMEEFKSGKADTISGISTPDDKTIEITLTKPAGDFLQRVAMPAAAPVPREVGECFKKAGEYGRYLVSSGPYMTEGSDEQDASSCDTLKPLSGFEVDSLHAFVRNPDYDPATDTTEARENFPDRFEFIINKNQKDIFDKVEAGEYEDELSSPLPQVLKKYSTTPELEDRLKINSGDRTWYVSMNLTQPPFDDVHVRMAANLVMDKEGLQRAWGGPLRGEIATHVVPDVMLNGELDDYDPYPSENFAGDVDAAKEHMKLSKYDTDKDGLCDAPECKGVLHYTRNVSPWTDMLPVEEASFEKIGIELQTRELADFYTPFQDVSKAVPIGSGAGWGKDYADASTFMVLFDSRSLLPTGNINYSLIGLTPEVAADLDVVEALTAGGTLEGIPSVDADIDACTEAAEGERNTCWAELDKKLMEEIVPWIPYLDATNVHIISPNVTQWDYDQSAGYTAYAHVAVDADAQ
ncbi:MAG TPA: ABC transporter substrate-binding protein [Actinomycetota bacterium]|nr:ABC transporter substrate-binding protein [Actinomycetota bacterium]